MSNKNLKLCMKLYLGGNGDTVVAVAATALVTGKDTSVRFVGLGT